MQIHLRHFFVALSIISVLFFFIGAPLVQAVTTTDLQGYWSLDEASDGTSAVTRNDSHSNNNHLTDNNTTASGAGILSNGADFERSNNEYLSIADASQTGLDINSDFTFNCWAKVESTVPNGGSFYFFTKYDSGTPQRAIAFEIRGGVSSQSLFMTLSPDGSSANATQDEVVWSPTNGTQYMVSVIYDKAAQTLDFYVDAAQQGVQQTGAAASIFNSSAPFTIGGSGTEGGYFDGILDECAIWTRKLSTTELTDLYNGGAGLAYPFSVAAAASAERRVIIIE